MKEDDMHHIAVLIDRVVTNLDKPEVYTAVKEDVQTFCRQFDLYPSLNNSAPEVGKRVGETLGEAVHAVEDVIESVVDEVKAVFNPPK